MRRGCRVGAWLCVLIALCAAGCGYLADLEGARYEARDAGGEEPTQDVPTSPMDALLDAGPEEEDVDDLVVLDAPEDVGVEGEDELQDVEVIGDVEGVEDVEDFEVVEGVEDVEVVEDLKLLKML